MIRWQVLTLKDSERWMDILLCRGDPPWTDSLNYCLHDFEEILYEAEYGDTDGFEHKVQ
jgi:hypothetical protein